ncbi:hypothetical protein C8R43DRAFT_1124590 [Mycena crocata]|nr:hypothetical protein C8R43DRAFT_1124590 [Mycena crocata]
MLGPRRRWDVVELRCGVLHQHCIVDYNLAPPLEGDHGALDDVVNDARRTRAPTVFLTLTTMQPYPTVVHAPLQTVPWGNLPLPPPSHHPRRSTHGNYSTRAVWGDSTKECKDNDTLTAQTSTNIASPQPLAHSNEYSTQHRVAHWVHGIQHTTDFEDPFTPRSLATGTHRSHRTEAERELPHVWGPHQECIWQTFPPPLPGPPYPQPHLVWVYAPAPVVTIEPAINTDSRHGFAPRTRHAAPSKSKSASGKRHGRKRGH